MRFIPRRFGLSLVVLALISAVSVLSSAARAQDDVREGFSGLPVPRFVALKKDEVYGRAAPDQDVVVIYQRRGLPVKVIAETPDNVWRRVEDHQGRKVWIHRSMLSENRHAVVRAAGVLFAEPSDTALPRARLEPGVMATLEACEGEWCRIRTRDYRGWTERQYLWGSPL